MKLFRLGVNYCPARTAMDWWSDYRAAEVEADFSRIADWGFGEVRIFLLWDAFQPAPDVVSEARLRDLAATLEIAGRRGLGLILSLFCGHMSGVNWLPAWALEPGSRASRFRIVSGGEVVSRGYVPRDLYTDPALLGAQVGLAERLAREVSGHPALAGWDLGNEFSNVRTPREPGHAAGWSRLLSETLQPSGAEVTGGLHSEDLEEDRHIRLSSIARPWATVAMHGYPMYSAVADGPDDPAWVPFLCALARAFAGRPALAQEFGLSDGHLDPERVAHYAAEVLERLWEEGAVGAYWWCFSDYMPRLRHQPPFDEAPHELRFGLVGWDGRPKPVLDAWRRFGSRPVREPRDVAFPSEDAYYRGLPETLTSAFETYRGGLAPDQRSRSRGGS